MTCFRKCCAIGIMLSGFTLSDSKGARAATVLTAAEIAAHSISLQVNSGKLVNFIGNVSDIYIANPKIADIKPSGNGAAFVFGVSPGETTLVGTNESGATVVQYRVNVLPSSALLRDAQAAIQERVGHDITVVPDLNGAHISGSVQNPSDADAALTILRGYLPKDAPITNDLNVRGAMQVLLRVRVVEMSRTLTRDLGVNWKELGGDLGAFAKVGLTTAGTLANAASGSNGTAQLAAALNRTNLEATIDALAEDQLVHTLAEPNLTAISGHAASFLVGGEFPIPIAQQLGQTSIQFKPYGVSLSFLPTVLSSGHINIKVRPEVSSLTNEGAVSMAQADGRSISVPAVKVRRAETTVELGSGQSFAIAGLLQDSVTQGDQSVPFLGDVPYLGALFRTDSFKRQQTELVIIVTPYIVKPVDDSKALHTPDENYRPPGDFDRLVLLRQSGRPPAVIHIGNDAGNVGFMVR